MTLEGLNPDITVTAFTDMIVAENVDDLVGNADIILDCMDNFPTRYLLNESAIRKKIPLVYGSIWGIDGRLSFIQSPETPCLRCIFLKRLRRRCFPCSAHASSDRLAPGP
jgi:adenylyltransferase/sulfurtransferase